MLIMGSAASLAKPIRNFNAKGSAIKYENIMPSIESTNDIISQLAIASFLSAGIAGIKNAPS